eukprot:jgi/Orpsp1_1/1190049/evm.model.d7180000076323.1
MKCVLNTVLTAISVSAAYIAPGTHGKNSSELYKKSQHILNPSNYNINPKTHLDALLPSSFDLRDVDGMNFISPVKNQGYSSFCWVFSGIAAAEASAQYELWDQYGISPDDLLLDFSELQMGYFAYTALQASETDYTAQNGEGFYPIDGVNVINIGGSNDLFISLLASGIGPSDEAEIPFISKSGNIIWVKVDENGKIMRDEYGYYIFKIRPLDWENPGDFKPHNINIDDEDWSVDLKKRFNSKLRLEHANRLPSPSTFDKNGDYHFDPVALDILKQEINIGHAIDVEFHTESNNFGDLKNPPKFLSSKYAHYTFQKLSPSHAVTIVGYDDNYSAKNFIQFDDEGNNIAPPGDGAFICKNSWGSKDDEYYVEKEYGVDGTGYFYLSYYDKGLYRLTTFDFSLVELTEKDKGFFRAIDQHDLLPANCGWDVYNIKEVVAMSNVFTPGRDELLEGISAYIFVPNTVVEYDVYKLNFNHTDPTDGSLVASGSQNVIYAGFHFIELETPIQIASTESYSIVIRQKDNEDNYYYGFTYHYSKEFVDTYNAAVDKESKKIKYYSVT